MSTGFWGCVLEPNKVYKNAVEEDFRITMATLNADASSNIKDGRISVVLQCDEHVFTLCNLLPGKIEQQPIDITFTAGEVISFEVKGDCGVSLLGNYVLPIMEDDDSECDSEHGSEDIIDLDEEELAAYKRALEEASDIDEEELAAVKRALEEGDESVSEEDEEEDSDVDEEELAAYKRALEEGDKTTSEEEEVVVDKKQQKPKAAQQQKDATKKRTAPEPATAPEKKAKVEEEKNNDAAEKKRTLPSGLIIEDKVIAKGGARAKNGKRLSMRYVGRLQNNKIFDQNTKGKPFSFILGRGEVIKGWDIGLQGMQVGGTRRLTIPAALAYGKSGAPPDIPSNATLIFDVKLLDVK